MERISESDSFRIDRTLHMRAIGKYALNCNVKIKRCNLLIKLKERKKFWNFCLEAVNSEVLNNRERRLMGR